MLRISLNTSGGKFITCRRPAFFELRCQKRSCSTFFFPNPTNLDERDVTAAHFNQAVQTKHQHMLKHPFIQELTLGTLPKKCFFYYLTQDRIFMRDYSELSRLFTEGKKGHLLGLKRYNSGITREEERLHTWYFKQSHIPIPEQWNYATFDYIQYLKHIVDHAQPAVVYAALSVCCTIYADIGREIVRMDSPKDNFYNEWIQFYGSKPMQDKGAEMAEMVRRTYEYSNSTNRTKIQRIILRVLDLECQFFEVAYNLGEHTLHKTI